MVRKQPASSNGHECPSNPDDDDDDDVPPPAARSRKSGDSADGSKQRNSVYIDLTGFTPPSFPSNWPKGQNTFNINHRIDPNSPRLLVPITRRYTADDRPSWLPYGYYTADARPSWLPYGQHTADDRPSWLPSDEELYATGDDITMNMRIGLAMARL